MKTFILVSSVAALMSLLPVQSNAQDIKAQGIDVGTPSVVRIGKPRHRHDRDYDGLRLREREVRYDRRSCKTVTITRIDRSMKRIRRCD